MNQSFDGLEQRPGTEERRERALTVGLSLDNRDRELVYEHLEELALLADTAGADVVDEIVQSRSAPDAATWIGKGKAEHVKAVAEELNADLIIVDDDLTPAQARNLERIIERRVIDRSGLILDIFARRARSSEARTQVELAQLNYLLPRLAGAWTHLERQRGGIGLRGPGETQLETDRRLVRTRIRQLKLELDRITRRQQTRRSKRDELFKVALVGYTNAGKSTLLNQLTGAGVLVEDRLFATLDATVRRLRLPGGAECLLADTVGFIRKLPHHLVASFRSTLIEAADADLLLHITDLANPYWQQQLETVREVLQDLGAGDTPVVHVFNKVDLVEDPAVFAAARQHEPALFVSATRELRLDELLEHISQHEKKGQRTYTLLVPHARYDLVASLRRVARVLDESASEEGYVVRTVLAMDDGGKFLEELKKAGCRTQ